MKQNKSVQIIFLSLILSCFFLSGEVFAYKKSDLKKFKNTKKCIKCDLSGANLQYTNLNGANLSEAILFRANLSDANLKGAIMEGANLRKAILKGAIMEGVIEFEEVTKKKIAKRKSDIPSLKKLIMF